jgi:outer membrane lipoprotein-sorting protein
LVHVTRPKRKLWRFLAVVSAAFAVWLAAGCAASHTTVVKPTGLPSQLQTATKPDLIARYNQQAAAVTSLNATITMTLTAGSAYTGVIKQYHEVKGFILAQKPSSIRVIGQAPVVGTNIFDMVSDGETFRIFIPSQNRFLTGPANLERPSAKPIENLRPQHLTGAIFWEPIPAQSPVLLEEANEESSRYYVLTVIRRASDSSAGAADPDWEIAQKVWFDRADLSVARVQSYDPGGKLASDIRYSGWDTFGTMRYPRQIALTRPGNDYKLQIGITKAAFNETISADRFVLHQPPGTELVNVGEEPEQMKPAEPKTEPKN